MITQQLTDIQQQIDNCIFRQRIIIGMAFRARWGAELPREAAWARLTRADVILLDDIDAPMFCNTELATAIRDWAAPYLMAAPFAFPMDIALEAAK